MSHHSAVRKVANTPARMGMRIVYSYDWTPERRQREAAIEAQCLQQTARRERRTREQDSDSGSMLKLSLAAAGVCASLFWAGYALLQWKHLL